MLYSMISSFKTAEVGISNMRDARMYNYITSLDEHIHYIRISRMGKTKIETNIPRIRFATDKMKILSTEQVHIK